MTYNNMLREGMAETRLDQITSSGVAEYGKLASILEESSRRISQLTKYKTFRSFLFDSIGVPIEDHYYGPEVFMTDKAQELPYPKTVYHVTGGMALKSLQEGKKLIPTEAHFLSGVSTDKGNLVHLVPAFMETLGVKLGNLREFIFSGPQIDAEQIAHQNNMSGVDIDSIGKGIFLQSRGSRYVLSDDLDSILRALDQGEIPFQTNLKETVDRFIEKMYQIPNIREGWLDHIRNILYGHEPFFSEGRHPSIRNNIEERLLNVEYMHRETPKTIPQPSVVLEIDTKKLVDPHGLTPVAPHIFS